MPVTFESDNRHNIEHVQCKRHILQSHRTNNNIYTNALVYHTGQIRGSWLPEIFCMIFLVEPMGVLNFRKKYLDSHYRQVT